MFLTAHGVVPIGTSRLRTICPEKCSRRSLRSALLDDLTHLPPFGNAIVTKLGVISCRGDDAPLLDALQSSGSVMVEGRASLKELVENRKQLITKEAYLVGKGLNDVVLTPEAAFLNVDEDTFRRLGIDTLAADDTKGAYRRHLRLEWRAEKLVERFLRLMDPEWFPTKWRGHAAQPLSVLPTVPCTVPTTRACGTLPLERDELLDWIGRVHMGMAVEGDARALQCQGPFGIREVESIIQKLEQLYSWFVVSLWTDSSHHHGVVENHEWQCIIDG